MALQTYYKARVQGLQAGLVIEFRSTETGKLITSGVIDSSGEFTTQYPASKGPCIATTRRVTNAQPWLDEQIVIPGQLFTSPNFGGKLLECRIGGTTGTTEPTEANRLHGRMYSRMGCSKYISACIRNNDGVYSMLRYGTSGYNDVKFDGNPSYWPLARIVELVASQNGLYALLDDGSVLFTSRSSASTSGGAYWGYEAVKLLPKIIKMDVWQYGIIATAADGTLWSCTESYGEATRYYIRDWIAANPTVKQILGGMYNEVNLIAIMADGTMASPNATAAAHFAAITDAESGQANKGLNNDPGWMVLNTGLDKLHYRNRDGNSTYDFSGQGERVARIMGGYGVIAAQMESGRHERRWTSAGLTSVRYAAQMATAGSFKPQEYQVYGNLWGGNPDTEPAYIMTPKGVWNPGIASGYSSGINTNLYPRDVDTIVMDGNPILQDGDCIFALIDPEASDIRTACVYQETIQVEAAAGADGQISGTLLIEGSAAQRELVAISAAKQGSERTVVGHATSAPGDGTYTMTLPEFTDPIMVIALDESGTPWTASTAVLNGDRVYPSDSAHTGLVYQAQGNGTTAGAEPTWPTAEAGTVVDNDITWTAITHYRGQLHGPVIPAVVGEAGDHPNIIWESDTYIWAGTLLIEAILHHRYKKAGNASIRIYRPDVTPSDIEEGGDTYEYLETIAGVLNYNVYANDQDANDKIYRRLDLSSIDTWLPIDVALPSNSFVSGEIATHYTVTNAGWGDGFLQNSVAGPNNPTYSYGGASDVLTSMYGRFPLPTDHPGGLEGYAIRLYWDQMSYSGDDTARLEIRFLNASNTEVGTAKIGADYAPDPGLVWVSNVELISNAIPATATQIELTWVATRTAGSNNNAYIDGYFAELVVI